MDDRHKLLRAVNRGDVEALREMRQRFKVNWNQCVYEKTGDSALHIAARANLPLVMKYTHI